MQMRNIYKNKRRWKFILLVLAVIIGALSLQYTNILVKKMSVEERKKMELWAEATRYVAKNEDLTQDINFYMTVITNNTTIPVILTDNNDSISSAVNLNSPKENDQKYLKKRLKRMKEEHEPIVILLLDGEKNVVYYEDSTILKQLTLYPYVQLGIISLFIVLAYFAFSSSRKSEQNQVWVGMSKETAHQLGTPISSLMAWIEILKQTDENQSYIAEMDKDVDRLQMIAERFSKIGSLPDLQLYDLRSTLGSAINYMQTRTSSNVKFHRIFSCDSEVILPLNRSLFQWVIENLVKNSVDAMDGKGTITIYLDETEKEASIRISDTGKGIPKNKQKTIFNPGYTSKERGWGLGLSLVRRIIENYHRGRIFVLESELNQGTTFKIILPK